MTAALNAGKTITEICWGRIPGKPTVKRLVGFRNLRAYRELNPKFDEFVLVATARSNSRAQQRRHHPGTSRIATLRDEANDFYMILGMVPVGLPSHIRDDIAQSIMLALLEGRFSETRCSLAFSSSSEITIERFRRRSPSSETASCCLWMR